MHSFKTISRNGSFISVPKKRNNNAGVMKIPAMLLITALQIDVATLPPPEVEDGITKTGTVSRFPLVN